MDFSIFDNREHVQSLTWLGRKDWMIYHDVPQDRSISAQPRKFLLKPRPAQLAAAEESRERPIIIGEKEYSRYPQNMWVVLREILNVLEFDVVGTLWYNTLAKALAGGPKLFRPTPEQCEALQHASARYAFKDYRQPYPVIVLEIPDTYKTMLREKYGIADTPKYVLVNHDDKNRFITVSAFYHRSNIITHITPDRAEYATIEDSLIQNRHRRRDSVHIDDDGHFVAGEEVDNDAEFDAAENVQRLGINFAMMMSLYSVKDMGPLDPTGYKIWQSESRLVRRGGVPTNRAQQAQINLAAAMHLLQFDQKVDFYDEIEERIEVAQGVDIECLRRSPKSHWRRGHFAMQPCGIGHRERKMIFRKPVLVRARYFFGDVKDASVTYTAHPGRHQHTPPQPPQPIDQPSSSPPLPPPDEPGLKSGDRIEVVQIDHPTVRAGQQATVTQVRSMGSDIVQIDAETEEGDRFSLIVPPDQYRKAS